MSSPDSSSEISTATLHLYRITGVVGLLLIKSGSQLANHMPFADARTNELGAHVAQMAYGYSKVKRRVRQLLMLFDSGSLLIVMRDQIQLALLLTPQADLDKASLAAGAFLTDYAAQLDAAGPVNGVVTRAVPVAVVAAEKENPKPVAKPAEPAVTPVVSAAVQQVVEKAQPVKPQNEVWPKVNAILNSILGKVMGSAQASRLISRMSEARHGNNLADITTAEAKALARAVLEQVPNRAKREALLSELEHAFTDANI